MDRQSVGGRDFPLEGATRIIGQSCVLFSQAVAPEWYQVRPTGPVTVLRRGVIRECSIVTLGADAKTSARLFSSAGTRPAKGTLLSASAYIASPARQAAGLKP